MKKSIIYTLLMLLSLSIAAQQKFQGTIEYKIALIGEGFDAYQSMMPDEMVVNVRKSQILFEIKGGMMGAMFGKMLINTKDNSSFMIKEDEEKVYRMPSADAAKSSSEPQITKLDLVENIAGYDCQKYKVVKQGETGEEVSYIWITDKFVMPEVKTGQQGGFNSDMFKLKGVKGTPLKISTTNAGMTVEITAKNVNKSKPSKDLFKLPKGFPISDFVPPSE